ncbi:MAG: hypothetical protein K2Y39_21280 [Candidatus Obscuribacterales bacterium]|nr:hypothetical protein [Candidatus Obscuribacterales bacterium]
MTVPILIGSANLGSGAQANDLAGRGDARQQFKLDNPELSGKAFNQAFKEHWQELRGAESPASSDNAAQAVMHSLVGHGANENLHRHDFVSKAEFQAYKAASKQEFLQNHIKNSIQETDSARFIKANQGFSLDLTSALETITLGNNLFREQDSITIEVGGSTKTLGAGSKVTAAEYVAAKQALLAGGQTVVLDANGRATGGNVDLSAMTSGNHLMKVDDLVVPVAVTASGDFAKGGDVRIEGDLINSGSINVLSDRGNVAALISADNITNNQGASINSTVSELTLAADHAFNNLGTINSAGSLTISGQDSVSNSGSIVAQQQIHLISPVVANSGTISSSTADVTFDALGSNLSVNNSGGTVSALNGAINIRNADYIDSFSSVVTGGDLLSRELNVYTGGGTADVFVNQLTGIVNASGMAVHVSADTAVLTLGKQCLIGDPTYFNTGDFVLDGDIIVGEDLAIIAAGNITATNNLTQIVAQDGTGQGFDISIIAGANITGSPIGLAPGILPGQTTTPPNITGAATSSVTIDGADANGGNVDLSGANTLLSINSSSALSGAAGGDVTIVAFAAAGTGGVINLPSGSTIDAYSVSGENGDVSILAGTSISLGSITNHSGTSSGKVTVANTGAVSSDGLPITFSTSGSITSGNSLVSDLVVASGGVSAQYILAGSDVSVISGGAISLGTVRTTSDSVFINNKLGTGVHNLSVVSIESAERTTVLSFGNINILGTVTSVDDVRIDNSASPGQTITVGGDISAVNEGVVIETGASGSVTLNGTSVTARDISIGTGSLVLSNMNTLSAGVDGSGEAGDVSVTASSVLTNNSNRLTLQAIGTGSGDGGNVSLTFNSLAASTVSSTGNFILDVSALGSGSGGTATATFAGDVTIDSNGIKGTGGDDGGGAIVSADGNITVNAGGIDLTGADGDGARISLIAGRDGSGVLNLNSTAFLSQANATGSNNDGGSINLAADVISFAGSHLTLQSVGTGSGNGGFVGLTLRSAGAVDVSSAGLYSFDVSAPGAGSGGSVDAFFGGSVTLGSGAVVGTGGAGGGGLIVRAVGNVVVDGGSINLSGANGSGARISLNAGVNSIGTLFLNDTLFLSQANATGANGDGGAITLTGSTAIQYVSSLINPLTLSANGIGTGDGGLISYRSGSTVSTFIVNPSAIISAKPPVNFLNISAESGGAGGNGGQIDISVGGALTVDPGFMTAGPQSAIGNWDGAFYSLQAGTVGARGGTLVVQGSINASGVGSGLGGGIVLSSRSSTAFSVKSGVATKNGVLGDLSAFGSTGFIAINNGLGGIKVIQNGAMNAPSILLVTGAKGSILANSGVVIDASSDLTMIASGTGAIGGKVPLLTNTPDLVAQSNGIVGITSLFTSAALTVHDSFGQKGFTLNSNSDTKLFDITAAAGSIVISQNLGSLLEVVDSGLLTAVNGGITLQNNNTVTGSIRVGQNATVQTLGKGKPVNIVFGPVLKTGTNPVPPGTAPAGIDAQFSGRGIIYFGPTGTVTSEGLATVNAKGVNVVFNSINNRPIILGDQSLVLADPPVREPRVSAAQIQAVPAIGVGSTESSNALASKGIVATSEYNTFTADLSIPKLDSSAQVQSANNATLMTASNASILSGALVDAMDNDDSFAVGFARFTRETDGVICSDSPLLSGKVSGDSSVKFIPLGEKARLDSGNMLIVPFRDTVVETPFGCVHVGSRAVVLVSASAAGLAVYDVDDKRKGSVVVESNGHSIVLSPGRHAMVTPHHQAEFAQINAIESIAHRNLSTEIKNGTRAHISEFSVISAMDSVLPLKTMFKSYHPQGKQAAGHMLKTAAIVLQMNGAGQYQHYFKPRLTAMK